MKYYRWDKKYLYWGITVFSVIVASLLFYFGLFHMDTLRATIGKINGILSPIIYGAIIAFLLNTTVRFFERKVVFRLLKKWNITITTKIKKITRIFAIFFTVIIFLLGIYAILAMLIPELFASIIQIVENFPGYVSTVEEWIQNLLKNNQELQSVSTDFFSTVEKQVQDWMNQELVPGINSFLKSFSTGLYGFFIFMKNFLIGIVVSIYLLYGKENFIARGKQFMYSAFKVRTVNNTIRDLQFINKMFGNYVVGEVIDSIIIGILCYLGMTILNLPYAVLISVIVCVTNIIPFFGPYLGAIPSAFLILIINPWQCLYFIIFILVLQQFDGNFLRPKILGDTTGLSSFLVIVSIIIGGGLFGIFGMFVGVPVCAVICTIMRNRMISRLQKKNLPIKLNHYDNIDHIDEGTMKPVNAPKNTHHSRNAFQYKDQVKKTIIEEKVIIEEEDETDNSTSK